MLLSSYGSWSITAMMAGFTVVSLISVLLLTETAGRGLGVLQTTAPRLAVLARNAVGPVVAP